MFGKKKDNFFGYGIAIFITAVVTILIVSISIFWVLAQKAAEM